jgi:hypothetical protein
MRIVHDYGLVRVVSVGDPFNTAYDIRVENYDRDADIWRLWRGFNSLSDDYAYTNAIEAAGRAIREVAKDIATGEIGTK